MKTPKIIDQWGNPINRAVLTEEIAGPSLTGVRSPLTTYPGDGLDPSRLSAILKAADAGDPLRYLELAETIEERDAHYAAVLSTRKRSVSQLEITVEAASEAPEHVRHADMISKWLKRDELQADLFDMLDAIGKGYSFTEIIWDTSEGSWDVSRLEWRDPRWFRFKREDLTTPVLIGDGGQELELSPFKFIRAVMKAKSGLPVRSGIARVAAWLWMFKAYTQRDWAVFTQTYGQPLRIGKYGPGATKDDKAMLFRAVANIAADCAAIIPESMKIEFIEAKNLGAGASNYKERIEHLDQAGSKLVLGQTTTTDAVSGGHAVSQEHRMVAEDIERADAKQMSAFINRDLIKPWVMLEFGPQDAYPRVKIGRAEQKDVKGIVQMVKDVVPLGIRVGKRQLRDLIGLGEPEADDELLTPPVFHPRAVDPGDPASGLPLKGGANQEGRDDPAVEKDEENKDGKPVPAAAVAPPSVTASRDISPARGEIEGTNLQDTLADAAAQHAGAAVAALLAKIRAMTEQAGSLEELKAMLEASNLSAADLAASMGQSLLLAQLTGQMEISAPASERSDA